MCWYKENIGILEKYFTHFSKIDYLALQCLPFQYFKNRKDIKKFCLRRFLIFLEKNFEENLALNPKFS